MVTVKERIPLKNVPERYVGAFCVLKEKTTGHITDISIIVVFGKLEAVVFWTASDTMVVIKKLCEAGFQKARFELVSRLIAEIKATPGWVKGIKEVHSQLTAELLDKGESVIEKALDINP